MIELSMPHPRCSFIQDECSFVSLRDVERAMKVMVWFYDHLHALNPLMDKTIDGQDEESDDDEDDETDDDDDDDEEDELDKVNLSLFLKILLLFFSEFCVEIAQSKNFP